MSYLSEIIKDAAELEFHGAANLIRHIDPFWQTEIGIERAWQARFVEVGYDKCDCPNCDGCREVRGQPRYVMVEAVTAAEAADLAELEADKWEEFEGIRLLGSNAPFAEPRA
jgi:hypothetical protein